MLDARYVRENVEAVRNALKKRGYEFPLAEFLAIDGQRVSLSGRPKSFVTGGMLFLKR